MHTLVILGSSLTGLAVARDAHAHGLQVVIADRESGPASYSRYVRRVLLPDNDESAVAALSACAGAGTALIASGDSWLRFVVRCRDYLAVAFELILHPSNEALSICLDKTAFGNWCASVQLPAPLSWGGSQDAVPPAARYPLLVRPAKTLHTQRELGLPKAASASNRAELDYWLQRFSAVGIETIVSESLLGRNLEQVSASFARRGAEALALVARKVRPAPARCAVGSCVELWADERALRLALYAAERLNYFGIGEMELLVDRDTGEYFVIEINARPWLQYPLAPQSGHDFLGLVMKVQARRSARRVTWGRTWIHLYDDLFNAFSRSVGEVRAGHSGVNEYLRSLIRCNVFAVFDWRDPGPLVADLARRLGG